LKIAGKKLSFLCNQNAFFCTSLSEGGEFLNIRSQSYINEYAAAIFYFCLHRVSNTADAEDLAEEINLCVLHALEQTEPVNLSGYVWRIARNVYARWAETKSKTRELFDDTETEEIPAETTPETDVIFAEDIRLLRRELAFIAEDYRKIVVAFYIDDLSVNDISKTLALPRGTVLSKLHRARKKLEEGMKMSREFGTLSYKPENIDLEYSTGCITTDGEPWATCDRLISKNLMLAAYRSPATAEQLAVELGVSLPYTQDELNHLEYVGLMKKNAAKNIEIYETAFFIISASAQDRMYAYARGIAKSLTEKVTAILNTEDKLETPLSCAWNGSLQSPVDARWARILSTYDWTIMERVKNDMLGKDYHFTKRKNGGEWDVYGREQSNNDQPIPVGLNNIEYVRHYRISYKDIWKETPSHLTISKDLALFHISEGNKKDYSHEDRDYLIENGYVTEQDGKYTVTFPIIPKELFYDIFNSKGISEYKTKYPEIEKLISEACDILKTYADFCEKEIKNDAPDFLKDNKAQIGFALTTCLFHVRGAILEQALKTGFLTYEPDADHRMFGAFLIK
jgi:RNA polymerase sigma-70 factor (ECF subfamily)